MKEIQQKPKVGRENHDPFFTEADRRNSASTIGAAFYGAPVERFRGRAGAVSAAKSTGGALQTLKTWLRGHKWAGGNFAQAQLIVADLDAFTRSLYGELECTDAALREAIRREEEVEGVEDVAEIVLAGEVTRSNLGKLIDAYRASISAQQDALARLVRRYELECK